MKTVLIKAQTKEDILNGVNKYQGQIVFGISTSGNIYSLDEQETPIQATVEDIQKTTKLISNDKIEEVVNKIAKGEIDTYEFNENDTSSCKENAVIEEEQSNEELNIDDFITNLNENAEVEFLNSDKTAELEKRIEKLEAIISKLPQEILDEITLKLSR